MDDPHHHFPSLAVVKQEPSIDIHNFPSEFTGPPQLAQPRTLPSSLVVTPYCTVEARKSLKHQLLHQDPVDVFSATMPDTSGEANAPWASTTPTPQTTTTTTTTSTTDYRGQGHGPGQGMHGYSARYSFDRATTEMTHGPSKRQRISSNPSSIHHVPRPLQPDDHTDSPQSRMQQPGDHYAQRHYTLNRPSSSRSDPSPTSPESSPAEVGYTWASTHPHYNSPYAHALPTPDTAAVPLRRHSHIEYFPSQQPQPSTSAAAGYYDPSQSSSTPPSSSTSNFIDTTPTSYWEREDEVSRLRTRIRELEYANSMMHRRVAELESSSSPSSPSASGGAGPSSSRRNTVPSSSITDPTLPLTAPRVSETFASEWHARTVARTTRFCSLNRAGNALCAWHDSRRERRAYPPRLAPPGVMNCGCTFEESLFEESLARHGVGSYRPGESVRMDPALRNPLLRLLQRRYGYRDGDFERDSLSGAWVEGEGPAVWEEQALLPPPTSSARKRGASNSS